MTDKELHRLSRSELLEMMIDQKRSVAAMKGRLNEAEEDLQKLQESYDRLWARLDEKDEAIRQLREELDAVRDKRETDGARAMAEVTARLEKAVSRVEVLTAAYARAMRDSGKKE